MMKELQTIEAEGVGQMPLFDYSALDAETRIVIQQRTGEIKTIAKRMASDVVEIGGKLAEVKDRLGGNGKFNEWLDSELHWSERTAYNFIAVWQKFNAANFALENVATSALYLLAAPSTPAEAVEVAKQIANSGEVVTHGVAKEIVRQAKERKPKQEELIEDPEYSAEEEAEPKEGADVAAAVEAPQELPAGWTWTHRDARVPSYRAENLERNLRTITLRTEAEVIRAAHEIEAAGREGLLGLTGQGLVSQGRAPQEPVAIAGPALASSPAIERHAAWYKTRIEISITFMPGGDAGTRKVMHTVRAGDGSDDMPFVAVSSGEAELLEVLPPITRGLVEKAAEAFAKKQVTKLAKSTKTKPAAKKPAAKSKAKEGKT
jgi:hypothetical protein